MKRKTHEEYVNELAIKNPNIEVVGEYQGSAVKILHRCLVCGHEWFATPNGILNGTGCRECYINSRRKTPDEYLAEVATINSNIKVIGTYVNENTHIEHQCSICGKVWSPRPVNVLQGQGCPQCTQRTEHTHFITYNEYVEEINRLNLNIDIIGAWKGTQTKTTHLCRVCGCTWEKKPFAILRGSGCPECNKENKKSKTELKVYYYLKQYFLDVISGYSDKENGISELDVYIPSLKMAIEYDGEFYHQDTKRDQRKDKICEQLGIKLIRIREPGCPRYESSCIFVFLYSHSDDELEKIITYILEAMGVKNPDINFKNDVAGINNLIAQKRRENSLYEKFPKVAEEWNYEKNGKLTPEHIEYASCVKAWWKCATCGYEWLTRVYNRTTSGAGCPKCGRERISKSQQKPVYCLELNKVFESVTKAGIEVGVNGSSISACCYGKYNYAGKNYKEEKLHWYYLYDQSRNDGSITQGAITLALIKEKDALKQLNIE